MRMRMLVFCLCLFFALCSLNVEAQTEKKKPEVFTGNALITTTGAAGSSTRLTITIEDYTTGEDTMKFVDILKAEGPDGLRKVLEKVEKGWIAPTGKIRDSINFARSHTVEGGRIINIVKTRHLRFIEFARSAPQSREYEFTFIQIKLDKEGKGEGYIFAGTKIEFDSNGKLVLEQRGTAPILIRGVKQKK